MIFAAINAVTNDELASFLHFDDIYNSFFKFLSISKLSEYGLHILTTLLLFALFVALLWVLDYVFKKFLLEVVHRFAVKTKTKFDDYLVENKVFYNVVHFIPALLAKALVPVFFSRFPSLVTIMDIVINLILVVIVTLLVRSIIKSIRDYAKTIPAMEDKPLDSFAQVFLIILYFFAGITFVSVLVGQSPIKFLVSLGAASAILMLVFKDTILGFVASIQVSTNDMVRVGDWIEMPKFGADGTVLGISLSTVKVQNFDKTITTIPTYNLISDSFKNWRGMQSSGGRRIKRSLFIKISSVRFLHKDEIDRLKSIHLLKPFIEERQREIDEYNAKNEVDKSMLVNGRQITNLGLFRHYVTAYAKANPNILKDPSFHLMVRHLQPTEHGLPLELYMFTNTTNWVIYEGIMADIFDHIFASIKFFDLEVFELPASDDIRKFMHEK